MDLLILELIIWTYTMSYLIVNVGDFLLIVGHCDLYFMIQ